jgi:hypothetical protein
LKVGPLNWLINARVTFDHHFRYRICIFYFHLSPSCLYSSLPPDGSWDRGRGISRTAGGWSTSGHRGVFATSGMESGAVLEAGAESSFSHLNPLQASQSLLCRALCKVQARHSQFSCAATSRIAADLRPRRRAAARVGDPEELAGSGSVALLGFNDGRAASMTG